MLDPFVLLTPLLALPVVGLLRFLGCSAFAAAPAPPGSSTPPITVTVTPSPVTVYPGKSVTFTAAVANSSNQNCDWTSSDGQSLAQNAPQTTYTAPVTLGTSPVTITAKAKADGTTTGTATVNLVPNSAHFVASDNVTKGNWNGAYGKVGWALAATPANLVSLPPYLANLILPPTVYSFVAEGTADIDSRCLLMPPTYAHRFLCGWIDPNSVQVEFNFTDSATHRVSIYCVDYDSRNRAQTVEMLDNSQTPPAVLDTQNLSAFDQDDYLVWDLAGDVILRITRTAGPNAVLCAIFFD